MLGLLSAVLHKFLAELQPINDISILFSLNILRMNLNPTKVCIDINIDKILAGIATPHFFKQSYALNLPMVGHDSSSLHK